MSYGAHGVRVDNWTNQPVQIPGAGLYCPPWSVGWSAPLPGTISAEARFAAPPGVTIAPTPLSPGTANIIFTSEPQPLSMGTSVGPPSSGQDVIGQLTAVTVNVAVTKRVTVPLGTHGIGINCQQLGDWGTVAGINTTIKGVQSGTFYVNQVIELVAGLTIVPISSPLDTEIDVTLYPGTVRNPAQIATILAIKDVEAVQTYDGFPFTANVPTVNQGQGGGPFGNAASAFYWDAMDTPAPYTSQGGVAPAAGAAGSVTFGAISGRQHVCRLAKARLSQGGATAGSSSFLVNDGASSIYQDALGTSNVVGTTDHAGFENGGFIGTVNTAMTVLTGAISATQACSVSAGISDP